MSAPPRRTFLDRAQQTNETNSPALERLYTDMIHALEPQSEIAPRVQDDIIAACDVLTANQELSTWRRASYHMTYAPALLLKANQLQAREMVDVAQGHYEFAQALYKQAADEQIAKVDVQLSNCERARAALVERAGPLGSQQAGGQATSLPREGQIPSPSNGAVVEKQQRRQQATSSTTLRAAQPPRASSDNDNHDNHSTLDNDAEQAAPTSIPQVDAQLPRPPGRDHPTSSPPATPQVELRHNDQEGEDPARTTPTPPEPSSYPALISQCFNDSPTRVLTVSEIYDFVLARRSNVANVKNAKSHIRGVLSRNKVLSV
ncbi:hypothetical protein CLAFUW4_07680 [Fulvia fulva]|nr:hypothetical protein CLAFUR4_07685 [Fulvia fulva]WPV12635.1 hypothetical protein CLAFUW4_07680 [Fulvia fulva]WPV27636.1 hypothetical protein CLAFUW7_07681 [Fulvia fulva]